MKTCTAAPDSINTVPGLTGQYAKGKPSAAYCNSRLYVAWTGTDDHINIGWNSFAGPFQDYVTFSDTTYYNNNANPTIQTGPTIRCWRPSSGQYSDATRLWIAFTGTNKLLYYGFFSGTKSDNVIHVHMTVPNQSSIESPAMAVIGGEMILAWRGNTTKYLYAARTFDNTNWYNFPAWTAQTSDGGPGLEYYCPPSPAACHPYIAWIGTDSPTHHINVGYLDEVGLAWHKVVTLADFAGVNDDLTLTARGSTLYMPYAGVSDFVDINVLKSGDGKTWTDTQDVVWPAIYGAGGGFDSGGHLWVYYPRPSDLQIESQQWT